MSKAFEEDGFDKVKRNLSIVSVLVIFYFGGGLSLDESNMINLLGNKFNVQRPEVFPLSLMLFFSYCFIRYFQSLLSFKKEELFSDYYEVRNMQLLRTISKKYIKDLESQNKTIEISKINHVFFGPLDKNSTSITIEADCRIMKLLKKQRLLLEVETIKFVEPMEIKQIKKTKPLAFLKSLIFRNKIFYYFSPNILVIFALIAYITK